jgi:hypothetical protein
MSINEIKIKNVTISDLEKTTATNVKAAAIVFFGSILLNVDKKIKNQNIKTKLEFLTKLMSIIELLGKISRRKN